MYAILISLLGLAFVVFITLASYKLGERKTENPKLAAAIGFFLAFLPPLALIYIAVLIFKEDVSIV